MKTDASRPNFSEWTLPELMLNPWYDRNTIEGEDFWVDVFRRIAVTRQSLGLPWQMGGTDRVQEWRDNGRP